MNAKIHLGEKILHVQVESDKKIIDVLREHSVRIGAPCGGGGTCGKCHVRTDGSQKPSANDIAKLSSRQIADGRRLSCCTDVYEGMDIFIDQTSEAIIQVDGIEGDFFHNPPITVENFSIKEPSLDDPIDYWERITERFPSILPKLPVLYDLNLEKKSNINVVLYDQDMPLAILYEQFVPYGIAFDIGTTTVVGYLVDLLTGKTIDTISEMNAQHIYGADVISRANYADSKKTLEEISAVVRAQIQSMIQVLSERNLIDLRYVFHLSFVGNTIMLHLLLNLPVKQITTLPFTPVVTRGLEFSAREIGLALENAMTTVLPSVSGFVGADTIAAILACNVKKSNETSLLVDIGTNGEIVLAHAGKLYCCSAAAGPAFEGAHISCGMSGLEGAISHVRTNGGEFVIDVIGGVTATGICGSGLVDVVAILLEKGILDETGRLDDETYQDDFISVDGRPAFQLTKNVYITQKDVREVQLAKAAIIAGINILLLEAQIDVSHIRRVFLAGGFGNHIDPVSACKIGILPKEVLEFVRPVGNAAGSGAKAALLDKNVRTHANDVRASLQYIELSARADFQDLFIENMTFE